jgi:hypothetical protein
VNSELTGISAAAKTSCGPMRTAINGNVAPIGLVFAKSASLEPVYPDKISSVTSVIWICWSALINYSHMQLGLICSTLTNLDERSTRINSRDELDCDTTIPQLRETPVRRLAKGSLNPTRLNGFNVTRPPNRTRSIYPPLIPNSFNEFRRLYLTEN